MSDTHYPDSLPDGLGDLKSIKRISGMKNIAPKIRWGEGHKKKSLRERLKYAEALASSMNHAADVLQTERNGLIKICKQQEKQIKQSKKNYSILVESTNKELESQNSERQKLYVEIMAAKKETKTAKRALALHMRTCND